LNDPSVTSAELAQYFEKLPKGRERDAGEILRSGLASANEMNLLFAAMATQAGLDARAALLASRNDIRFEPKSMVDRYFIDHQVVSVKVGPDWKFVNVSERALPTGTLPWAEEGVQALISDPKEPTFVRTPVSEPAASLDQNTAKLKLSDDGSLSGEVEYVYTGHRGAEYRHQLRVRSAAQREEWFHDRIVRMFPSADVTDLKIENVDNAYQPLRITYRLEAPHFAEVTGKRIIFQPSVFRRNEPTPFSASERRYMVEFPYPWREVDQIQIDLPQGFALDHAEAPDSFGLGNVGSFTIHMAVSSGPARYFVVTRELVFGSGGAIYFGADKYPALKNAFEQIRISDGQSISLKAQ